MRTCTRAAAAVGAGTIAALAAAGEARSQPIPASIAVVGVGAQPAKKNAADVYREVHESLGKDLVDALKDDKSADAKLGAHAADIEKLVEASRAPRCNFGVDYSGGVSVQLPHLGMIRALARVLKADAARLLSAGDAAGACRRIAAIERMGTQVIEPAHSVIELLVACAVGHLGADFVKANPALAKGKGAADLQQAIKEMEQSLAKNGGRIVRRDGELWVRSLRDGQMPDTTKGGGRDWTTASQADRDAAAKKLAVLYADAAKAWDGGDAVSRLEALNGGPRRTGSAISPRRWARPAKPWMRPRKPSARQEKH